MTWFLASFDSYEKKFKDIDFLIIIFGVVLFIISINLPFSFCLQNMVEQELI